jgi:hypothetical protein
MLAKTTCERSTTKKFRTKLKPYHHHFEKCSKAVTVHGGRKPKEVRLGDLVKIPDSDLHHVMEPDAMLAISHAIEDIAGDIRQGELIATFQNFENFLPEKKRYMSLAEDLDAVRVWGCGEVPKKCGKIDFVQTNDERLSRYWLVLFDSPDARAVLLGRQVNKVTRFAEKKFVGFYSFNPYLVQSIRWRFNLLSCGLNKIISHWEKSVSLPDLKMCDLERYLKPPGTIEPCGRS